MDFLTLLRRWLLVWLQRQRRQLRIRLTRIVSSSRTALTSSVGMLTSACHVIKAVMGRRLVALKSPTAQLLSAIGGCVGGAALIGWWMVGIVLMAGSVAWGVDAFLRDDGKRAPVDHTHADVIERYRRAA